MLHFYALMVVQIVLESLPVSSSGHLKLLEKWLSSSHTITSASSANFSLVYPLLHGITAILLMLYFFKRWFFLLKHPYRSFHLIAKIIGLTFIVEVITVIFFLGFRFLGIASFPVGVGFLITGGILASLYWCKDTERSAWTVRKAGILGIAQGVALLPGISRLGTTYAVARWLHIRPKRAFEISFLIEWPLITAAFLYSLLRAYQSDQLSQFLNPLALFVMLASSGVAWLGLWLLEYLALTGRIWWFAFYMIVPACAWMFLC